MLQFFRINDPYRLVLIFIILVLVRLAQSFFIADVSYYELKWLLLGEWLGNGFSLYSETFDYVGPLAALVYKSIDLIFGRSLFAHHMLSTLLIIVQAGIFNNLLLKNKAYEENGYLPAFLYVIVLVAVPDFMSLSPPLLSLTFILLAMRNVLRRIDNLITDELFLNSGFFIGVATMLYLPSIVFFLVFLFSLILFSTAVARRLLLYSFGFMLVFSLCALYFYWYDSLDSFLQCFITDSMAMPSTPRIGYELLLMFTAPFLFLLVLSVLKTILSVRLTNFQQKIQQVIWMMLLGGIGAFFLSNEKSGLNLVFVAPVIAYFWTLYFFHLKKWIFKLLMPGFLIFGLVSYSGFMYYFMTGPLEALGERVPEKTMILGEEISAYKEVEMSTPCFNEYLSRKAFNELNYYDASVRFYKMLKKADPEQIVDRLGVMNQLNHRFPHVEKSYELSAQDTYTKTSN